MLRQVFGAYRTKPCDKDGGYVRAVSPTEVVSCFGIRLEGRFLEAIQNEAGSKKTPEKCAQRPVKIIVR